MTEEVKQVKLTIKSLIADKTAGMSNKEVAEKYGYKQTEIARAIKFVGYVSPKKTRTKKVVSVPTPVSELIVEQPKEEILINSIFGTKATKIVA